ncbi:relaxase/mobilization nuclease domain-containing protein [Cruoricaptor ignavus]|uniref:Relaxase/mobilization nuclease domain-containing protein n=1 Tax=Cruoricaptor ignavus TaxID=1118202 RepID=A0A7M1T4F3_9FLAO|nr:relaxase/mobilization nuclease domain-containing protein [Cruoricaptor ignavus]QOR74625.1 relaxase/mobilization nuclease domain-containing protein [Cruoricaptor ignavus]
MNSAGDNFNGVKYNDKKIANEKGELMLKKNFPSYVGDSAGEVRIYLKAISQSERIKKPQFHAVISSRFREQSKEELTDIAQEFMNKMGYGEQPYIVVFHNDTENNHVHIVSTRVSKSTGKKINASFERLKAQQALRQAYAERFEADTDKRLDAILKYRFTTKSQLEEALKTAGYKAVVDENKREKISIYTKGIKVKEIEDVSKLFQEPDEARKNQVKAILAKYSKQWSGKVFTIEDKRYGLGLHRNLENVKNNYVLNSELQHRLKESFGMAIVFHSKDGRTPFGYTLIDHSTGNIYKGSSLLKMERLFQFTDDRIDKKTFESVNDFKIGSQAHRDALVNFLSTKFKGLKPNMVLGTKGRITFEERKELRKEYIKLLRGVKSEASLIEYSGKKFIIDFRSHKIESADKLLSQEIATKIQDFSEAPQQINLGVTDILKSADKIIMETLKPHYTGKTTEESGQDNLLKRKRRKRR